MVGRNGSDRRKVGYVMWAILAMGVIVPLAIAATSPLLAWRGPVYIAAGFAGIAGLAVLLAQPLLAAGSLAGIGLRASRKAHRYLGGALVFLVLAHVGGLWITSPPDVVDALLLRSPTSFSIWGVTAMWAVLAAALLAAFRSRLPLGPIAWKRVHSGVAAVIVVGTVIHALQIDGTMGTVSKVAMCALAVALTVRTFIKLRIWSG